jgi:hypothetical protein
MFFVQNFICQRSERPNKNISFSSSSEPCNPKKKWISFSTYSKNTYRWKGLALLQQRLLHSQLDNTKKTVWFWYWNNIGTVFYLFIHTCTSSKGVGLWRTQGQRASSEHGGLPMGARWTSRMKSPEVKQEEFECSGPVKVIFSYISNNRWIGTHTWHPIACEYWISGRLVE